MARTEVGYRFTARIPPGRKGAVLGAMLLIAGCGPGAAFVADPGFEGLAPPAAASAPAGARVVWAGVIADIEYGGGITVIEVVAHPSRRSGRPDREAPSAGRFRVRRAGYLDLAEWLPGREVTVAGRLAPGGAEHPRRPPTVEADALRLWPEPSPGLLPFGLRFGFEISN